ncbi:uncharacterized protein LOC128955733 [Oppia nitens]|uniref:uncharacterized protein LOC128955733 n=1 Tax=Oppia nitens TaxID=1686743 RepID=UPI0023DA276A|nr:uncharacterized protein LOC128955733 [Oppia nitens]
MCSLNIETQYNVAKQPQNLKNNDPIGRQVFSDTDIVDTNIESQYRDIVFTDYNSNNVTGFGSSVVPNIVHYVVLDNPYMDFSHYVSVLSVLRNQKPVSVVFHCNCDRLRGRYWEKLMSLSDSHRLQLRSIVKPVFIFGKKLSSVYHQSDIVRIDIMMRFGGIFLDNDVYVVKSLDIFRKYEFTIGWPLDENIGTQILIGHKNARFPRLWYESYKKYRPTRWYYNAGQLPTQDILNPKPSLVHREPRSLGVQNLVPMLYNDMYPLWEQNFYTIHLLSRHKSYLVPNDPIVLFDERNIRTYNKTFGQMARLVLFDSKDLISNAITDE